MSKNLVGMFSNDLYRIDLGNSKPLYLMCVTRKFVLNEPSVVAIGPQKNPPYTARKQ